MPSIFFKSSSVSISSPASRRRRRAMAAYRQELPSSSTTSDPKHKQTEQLLYDCSSSATAHTTNMNDDRSDSCCPQSEEYEDMLLPLQSSSTSLIRSVSSLEQSVQNAVGAEINMEDGVCVRSQKLFYQRHETSKVLEYKVVKMHERLHLHHHGDDSKRSSRSANRKNKARESANSSSSNHAEFLEREREHADGNNEIMTFVQPVLKPSSSKSRKKFALRALEQESSGSNHSTNSQGLPRRKSAADLSFVLCGDEDSSSSQQIRREVKNSGGDENDHSFGNQICRGGERWGYFVAPVEADSPVKQRRAIF